MAAGLLAISAYTPARDRQGRLVPGARMDVFLNRTTVRATVYAEASLSTPLANPVVANSSGQFPAVWAQSGSDEDPNLYTVGYSMADGGSIGNPSVFDDVRPSVSIGLVDSPEVISQAVAQAVEVITPLTNPADYVYPEIYGATGDGVYTPAERTAFITAHNIALMSGRPLVLTGRYNVGPAVLFTGPVHYMGVGASPKLIGAVVPAKGALNTGTTIQIEFDNGTLTRSDTLAPSYRRPFAEKSLWLGRGDQAAARHKPLDLSSAQQVVSDFPSDDWTPGVYGGAGDAGIGFSLTTALRWTGLVYPVHGRMELTASVTVDGPNVNRGLVVLCTGGHFVFWASQDGVGTWYYKGIGGPYPTENVDWSGRTTHASWQAQHCDWTLRLYDATTIGIVLNGVEIFRYTLPVGSVIDRGGFVAMKTDTDAGVSIEWLTATRLNHPQGGQEVRLAVYGDSKSDGYFGDWTDAFREALDGSAGIRVTQIVNHAVSGDSSYAQMLRMQMNPPVGMTDSVIHVGTNDVQGLAPAEASFANIEAMIDMAVGAGNRVHLVVPDLWYGQAEAGGWGENTNNYAGGARTRTAIQRLAAERGCRIVNAPQLLGAVLGSQITDPDISDPRLRDSIHPTSFTYRLIGMEIARSVLAAAAPIMTRSVADRPIPAAWQNGWAAGSDTPSYRVSEDGVLSMSGFVTAGTKVEGTTLLKLPRSLWPRQTARVPAWGGTGWAALEISAGDGSVKGYNLATVTYLALDAIRYVLMGDVLPLSSGGGFGSPSSGLETAIEQLSAGKAERSARNFRAYSPTYDLSSGGLAVADYWRNFDFTVPAGKQLNLLRMDGAVRGGDKFKAIAFEIDVYDSDDAYAVIGAVRNRGTTGSPAKAIYGRGVMAEGATGFAFGLVAGVTAETAAVVLAPQSAAIQSTVDGSGKGGSLHYSGTDETARVADYGWLVESKLTFSNAFIKAFTKTDSTGSFFKWQTPGGVALAEVGPLGEYIQRNTSNRVLWKVDNGNLYVGGGTDVSQKSAFFYTSATEYALQGLNTDNVLRFRDNTLGRDLLHLIGGAAGATNGVRLRVGGAMKEVAQGDADSAGSGRRLLWVPN